MPIELANSPLAEVSCVGGRKTLSAPGNSGVLELNMNVNILICNLPAFSTPVFFFTSLSKSSDA
jgi:hypothetical protein